MSRNYLTLNSSLSGESVYRGKGFGWGGEAKFQKVK